MAAQLIRFAEGPNPEKSAESPLIDDQVQGLFELQHQLRQSLQCERIGAAQAGVPPLTETLKLSMQ